MYVIVLLYVRVVWVVFIAGLYMMQEVVYVLMIRSESDRVPSWIDALTLGTFFYNRPRCLSTGALMAGTSSHYSEHTVQLYTHACAERAIS